MPPQSEGVANIAATGRARRHPCPLAVNVPPNGPACWWAAPRITRRQISIHGSTWHRQNRYR